MRHIISFLLLVSLFLSSSCTEVLVDIFFGKGHFNPHVEVINEFIKVPSYHVTVVSRNANFTEDVFPSLQKIFGDKVCYHGGFSNKRSAAFDCPITYMPLDTMQGIDEFMKALETGKMPMSTSAMLSMLNPAAPVEHLYHYYFDQGSTLPKPQVYIGEAMFGVEPFALILKQKLGRQVQIFTTLTSTSVVLPSRHLELQYLSPVTHFLLNYFSPGLSGKTDNPFVMLMNSLIGKIGPLFLHALIIIKNNVLPRVTSTRPEIFPFTTLEKQSSIGDYIFFSKDGVQEPPNTRKNSNFHYLGSSLPVNPTSDSEVVTAWMDEMQVQGRQVIFISMGSMYKMTKEHEDVASAAIIQLMNRETSKYALIWRVSKLRMDTLRQRFAEQVKLIPGSTTPFFITADYLPQRYIMHHNATSLFVTHCGFNGVTEALFFGKKLLGFPMSFEQKVTCQRITDEKVGRFVDKSTVTTEQFYEALVDLLHHRREEFTQNARNMQRLLQNKAGIVELVEEKLAQGPISYEEANVLYMSSWIETVTPVAALALLVISFMLLKRVLRCVLCCGCCRKTKQIKQE